MAPTLVCSSTLSALYLISLGTFSSALFIEKRDLVAPLSPAANWSLTGCWTDGVGGRTLSGANYASGNSMTNEACVAFCISKNSFYAGTEYSGECYCGNSLATGSSLADSADCNMACSGNATEQCGGPNRLTLYNTTVPLGPVGPFTNPGVNGFRSLGCYTDSLDSRTLTTAIPWTGDGSGMTVALCTSQCAQAGYIYAGIEYADECYCGNAIAISGSPAPIGDCSMVCNGNSSEYCGGSNRMNILTSRAAPPGWTSLGCYTDSVGGRTLTTAEYPAGAMTIELCTQTCQGAGPYTYAGVEYGGECYCGNTFQNGGGPAPDGSAGCNMPCNGNAQETCGGSNRLSVFQLNSTSSPSGSATASASPTSTGAVGPTTLPSGWKYRGCYIDNANGRVLIHQDPDSTTNTVESCVASCVSQGYSVAGMQYGAQCFCDNYIRNGGTNTSDSDCNMACAGNSAEKCGAGNRDSIYSNSSLVVYQPPAAQNTSLPGSWQYQGCYSHAAGTQVLKWQLILTNNNSASTCLKQCSDFGYPAASMEYGEECYCGDTDQADTNAVKAPESECNMACTGNASYICGGSNRLNYYKWVGDPLYVWNHPSGNGAGAYEFLIGGVIIPLISQPAVNGKVTFLEKWGTGPPNTTGAYELDLTLLNNFTAAWRPMHVKTDVFCSGGLTLPDKVGRQINIGGWANDATYGIRLYWPDGSPGVWGKNDWQENVNEVALQAGRWYPTAMIMANGSILVVGGEVGSGGAPTPSLELLPKVGAPLFCDWLNRTDPNNLYPYMSVLPSTGILAIYYNEARILDEVTLQTKKVLPNVPGAVNDFRSGRTYPFEGSALLLPQHAPYTDNLEVLVCGGSGFGPAIALDNCALIEPDADEPKWTIERMPSQRVLSCIAALPDGTYLILNGATQGVAGFGLANDPNHNAVLYDPSKPIGQRMSIMANTTVDRMYHSEAVLLDDGRVIVSGSDPEQQEVPPRYPQEYRVEVFIPPYLMGDPVRPVVHIANNSKDWSYGGSYSFTSSQAVSKVSLLGATSSTHGNSMGQRTIFPAFSCSGTTCTVTAPPNAHVCPPGWFQLFALNAQGVPSVAVWVRIGGDPGELGNWPPHPDFDLPGI